MPTYEYRCSDCGENLEVVQSFHDDPLTECPKCHGKLRKVFGSIGISFKGSGFYRNDSRSSTSASAGSSSSSGNGDNGSSGSDGTGAASPSKQGEKASSGTESNGGSSSKPSATASSSS